MKPSSLIHLGTAGWSLPREYWPSFPTDGTHLQRYGTQMNAVEINSSFYRPHRAQTYRRWAESVPAGFRFAVKMPKTITHVQRLLGCEAVLDEFFQQCLALDERLGCVLIQLPPSLVYEVDVAEAFFAAIRRRHDGAVVLEPRHASWRAAEALLIEQRIGRVAADPTPIIGGTEPGGWTGVRYWRLHGSPRIYHSDYDPERLAAYAAQLLASAEAGVPTWCIFDNTASGFALGNALGLQTLLLQAKPQD